MVVQHVGVMLCHTVLDYAAATRTCVCVLLLWQTPTLAKHFVPPQFGGWHAAVVCVLLHHTPSLAPHCVVHVQAALLLTRVCV